MRFIYTLLLSLCTPAFVNAQIKSTILDSSTKEPIPYVNIWVSGDNNGTTADENGNFSLAINSDNSITLSAVGYEKMSLKGKDVSDVIYMRPKIIELNEVIIERSKNIHTLKIGSLKKPKMTHYIAMVEDFPVMHSNYYPYKEDYAATPYLKSLKLITFSEVKSAIFNLRFYTADKNGKPGEFLCDENIICEAKKGKHTNTIDLSKYNIKFPKSGVFVTVEWLVSERNRYYYIATSEGQSDGTVNHIKKRDQVKTYLQAPSIGATGVQADIDRWTYNQGSWNKQIPRQTSGTMAFEIILTN